MFLVGLSAITDLIKKILVFAPRTPYRNALNALIILFPHLYIRPTGMQTNY